MLDLKSLQSQKWYKKLAYFYETDMNKARSYHVERWKFSNLLDSPQEVFKLLQPQRN